jgi:hypothetical protein
LSETSSGVVREGPLEEIFRVKTGIAIDTVYHVVTRLSRLAARSRCRDSLGGIVSEDIDAGHLEDVVSDTLDTKREDRIADHDNVHIFFLVAL